MPARERRRANPHHLGQMVGLFIEPPVLFPQRSDGIGQFVHAFGACAQQYFEPVGVAFFVCEVAAQLDDVHALPINGLL